MIRVAFLLGNLGDNWIGGKNYLANLLLAIKANQAAKIEPVLIVANDTPADAFSMFPPIEIIRSRVACREHVVARLGRLSERLIHRDLALEFLLRLHRIDLLSHFGSVGAKASVPTLTWIPDFQHVRMPEFFSDQAISERDRDFRKMVDSAKHVVLSSQDAQGDLEQFMPGSIQKSSVLHFVSGLSKIVDEATSDEVLAIYGLSGPFFHLPNQFWAHKNHRVVIDALANLKQRGIEVTVAATGHNNDQRNPSYFPDLLTYAAEHSVTENFRVLGVIPYAHLSILMQRAIAVINPSLFEGWSTTVEEAKSLGKVIILSDIPVHKEQAPERGLFFPPHDAQQLADMMHSVVLSYRKSDEHLKLEEASIALSSRYSQFARTYENIVAHVVNR